MVKLLYHAFIIKLIIFWGRFSYACNVGLFFHFMYFFSQSISQSLRNVSVLFGQILLRTDTRLVFCNRKLIRTDIFFTWTTKRISTRWPNPRLPNTILPIPFCRIPHCRLWLKMTKFHPINYYLKKIYWWCRYSLLKQLKNNVKKLQISKSFF